MPGNQIFYFLTSLFLFLFATGASYWLFSYGEAVKPKNTTGATISITPSPVKKSKIDPSIPRTEVCPLNGALFTKQERDVWETRRPLGVMVENSVDARPQSGLSTADIVYEAIAEGGITRFMAVFYCGAASAGNIMIAPVRSARIHFVNLIAEYDGLYNHVGGAGNCDDPNVDPRAKALCAIKQNKIKSLDQFGLDFKTCRRVTNRLDREVAYEHTMACFLEEIYKVAANRGWTGVDSKGVAWNKNFNPWLFKSPSDKLTGDSATTISYYFWGQNRGVGEEFNKAYDVVWRYEPESNAYIRSTGGEMSTDLNTGETLKFPNVVVQFVREISTGDLEKHMLYEVIGAGKAVVFMDGVATQATWSKTAMKSRTIYKDSLGNQIRFNPGPIWVSILPSGNQVTYQ